MISILLLCSARMQDTKMLLLWISTNCAVVHRSINNHLVFMELSCSTKTADRELYQ